MKFHIYHAPNGGICRNVFDFSNTFAVISGSIGPQRVDGAEFGRLVGWDHPKDDANK